MIRSADIVTQLAVRLPQLTDRITNDVPVNSLTRSGTLITAACDEKHGLKVNQGVAIVGAKTPIVISTFTRSGAVGTITTATDHDRTLNLASTVKTNLSKTVLTSGATESEFNGTFTMNQVVNRRTILVAMTDAGPTAATGSPILEDGESLLRDYNTTFPVAEVLDEVTFKFVQSDTTIPSPIGTITARTKPRITLAVDIQRAIASYTEQKIDELWLYVVLEEVFASKDRGERSDAVSNRTRGTEFRQQVVQPITLYLFVPVSGSVSGQLGRDEAEDLFRPLCRSLLFSSFDSGLAVGAQNPVQFVSHGAFRYNTAVYVHAFGFQQVADLTFDDTVGADLDIAFREIDFTMFPDVDGGTGVSSLTATIDLDDTPLP